MVTVGSRIKTALRWMVLIRFSVQIVNWGCTLVVIRLLTPDDYGLLALSTMFIGFVTMFTETNTNLYLVQRQEIDDTLVRQTFGFLFVSNFALALFVVASAPLVATFFHEPRIQLIVQVLAIPFAVAPFQAISGSLLVRSLSFGGRSLVDGISALATSLASVALAYHGFGVWSLVYATVLGSVVRSIGYQCISPYLKKPEFSVAALGDIFSFGYKIIAQRLMVWMQYSFDSLLLGRMYSKELVGYYAVGMQLISLPEFKLGEIVNSLSFAGFSRVAQDPDKRISYIKKSMAALGAVIFPISFGMSCTAQQLAPLVLGEHWAPSIIILQILGLAVPFRVLRWPMVESLNAVGYVHQSTICNLIACVFVGVAMVVGVQWGIVGAALAWLASAPATLLYIAVQCGRHGSLSILGLIESLYRPVISASVMYVAVLSTRYLLAMPSASFVGLGIEVSVGAVTYLTMMIAWDRPVVRELCEIAGLRPVLLRWFPNY